MNSKAYKEYKISDNEYRELKYFCLRYNEMKSRLEDCYGIKAVDYGKQSSSKIVGNPTEYKGIKAALLSADIELIDKALALTVDEPIRKYLKRSVINPHISYDSFVRIPMGRQQFYEMRRRFFFILKTLKMG